MPGIVDFITHITGGCLSFVLHVRKKTIICAWKCWFYSIRILGCYIINQIIMPAIIDSITINYNSMRTAQQFKTNKIL